MPFNSQSVSYCKAFRGVVVRPPCSSSRSSSAAQTFAFFADEVRELLEASAGGTTGAGKAFHLSAQPLAIAGELRARNARCPIYDPTSDCVFFIDDSTSIKRLDRSNAISLVVGREWVQGDVDGPGEAASSRCAMSLAADGKGNVFIAEDRRIRMLDVRTGGVRTLGGSAPISGSWTSITYDVATDVLVAATPTAVCHIPLMNQQCSSGGGGASAATPRLIAGSWSEYGDVDGSGTAARFYKVYSVLACAGGTILIRDDKKLRNMVASGAVTTLLDYSTPDLFGCVRQMTYLPAGEVACTDYNSKQLVIISNIGFLSPSSEALAGRIPAAHGGSLAPPDLLDFLLTPLEAEGGNTSVTAIVTINAGGDGAGSGGGKSFTAHRSVLAARSEYFKTRLAADSGFADSGAAKVSLPDAHPEAFGRLLVYMYTGPLVVPNELLRPAVELARWLLMPADCIAQLYARLMAAVTSESVVSDLVWANQYGMDELVPQLKAYLVRHWKEVAAAAGAQEGLSALAAMDPDLAAELMLMQ